MLRVLEAWGYVDGWSLTPAGEQLARVYTETDLLVTEALSEGLLDGLRVARARRAGVVLHLRAARPRWPGADAAGALADQDRGAAGARRSNGSRASSTPTKTTPGCPRPALPTRASRPTCTTGRPGDALADVLDDDEMTGGDFVRNVKQCIDLLRQIAEVAPDPATRTRARDAADACHRGVVAASGVAG